MIRQLGIPVLMAWASVCLGQNAADLFQKAPPEVDEALRARVAKFFQAHVDGRFRLADALVAEDSKDAFFEANKRRYQSFEIIKISYAEDFTKAVVLVGCNTEMSFPMAAKPALVKLPVRSNWKLVDAQWFWYAVPETSRDTPFGKMTPGPSGDTKAPGGGSIPEIKEPNLQGLVKADKTEVQLSEAAPSAEVVISNQMPGSVSVSVEWAPLDAMEAKLDRRAVNSGEKATLSLRLTDRAKLPASPFTVRLRVEPLNQVILIQVTVAPRVNK